METVQYTLKSNPEVLVLVPADYASKAEGLVKLAVEDPRGLVSAVSEHPYLGNIGILSRVTELAKTPQSLRLQDEVYLRVCIYGNEQKIRGPERSEALELDYVLIQAVQDLRSR